MNIDSIRYVYLIGIGGIGMSALARFFRPLRCVMEEYDKTDAAHTKQGVSGAISVSYAHYISVLDDASQTVDKNNLVISSPAVPAELKILTRFRGLGHTPFKRSQVIGL